MYYEPDETGNKDKAVAKKTAAQEAAQPIDLTRKHQVEMLEATLKTPLTREEEVTLSNWPLDATEHFDGVIKQYRATSLINPEQRAREEELERQIDRQGLGDLEEERQAINK